MIRGFAKLRIRIGGAVLKALKLLRHQPPCILSDLHQLTRGLHRTVEHAVEHVLHRPGEIADAGGAHHASAALQRVERAPYLGASVRVALVCLPARQGVVQRHQHFVDFFREDVEDVVIDAAARRRRLGVVETIKDAV